MAEQKIEYHRLVGSDAVVGDVRVAPAAADLQGGIRSIDILGSESSVQTIRTTYKSAGGDHAVLLGDGGGNLLGTVTLEEGERIVGLSGRSYDRLDKISFITRRAKGLRVFGPYGSKEADQFWVDVPVTGFSGSYTGAAIVDLSLSAFVTMTDRFGSASGIGSCQPFENHAALSGQQIQKIVMYTRIVNGINCIDGMAYNFGPLGGAGNQFEPVVHRVGDCSRVDSTTNEPILLNPGEWISVVLGGAGATLNGITFVTDQGRVFGPYGNSAGIPFIVAGRVIGFHGQSGACVGSLGFYTI